MLNTCCVFRDKKPPEIELVIYLVEETVLSMAGIPPEFCWTTSQVEKETLSKLYYDHKSLVLLLKNVIMKEGENLLDILKERLLVENEKRRKEGLNEVLINSSALNFLSLSSDWTTLQFDDVHLLPRSKEHKKRFVVLKTNRPRKC